MGTGQRHRFLREQTAWMLGAALLLVLFDSLTYELFFVISFIGFLAIIVLTDPPRVRPRWRRRLRWLVPPALLVFALIVARRAVTILPGGVF